MSVDFDGLIREIINTIAGFYPSYPASSCAGVFKTNPYSLSGYYWVLSSNHSAVRVYCDMTRACGNMTGGWMRVVELDMSDNSSQCPSSLCLNQTNPRTCRICTNFSRCSLDKFFVGVNYSRVCGRVIGYQIGTVDAYSPMYSSGFDGVNLTYGTPLKSIWTFVAATAETYGPWQGTVCPCINKYDENIPTLPPFIGEHYFCDAGSVQLPQSTVFYSDDPLWDGAGCGTNSTCCSFNNPPWFYTQFSAPTTEDIEMRVCRDSDIYDEDIAIEAVDIFVQ